MKIKHVVLLLVGPCLFIHCKNDKQISFWESPQAYLGQKPPSETPEIFAKTMLVDSGIVLGRVAFSDDGKDFYYTYAARWFDPNNSGTNVISFNGTKWSKPQLLAENVSNPTLSIDNKTLYFGVAGGNVWISEKKNDNWTAPKEYLNKSYGLYNFMPTRSGTNYVGSGPDKNDYSTYDFSTFNISKNDTIIKSIGSPINTIGFDGDLYVAPDESYMIISAEETPTYESKFHITFRNKDGTWSKSKSISKEINEGMAHRFGQYVSPDGKYLFYTQGTSEADCHIYWVRWDGILAQLRRDLNRAEEERGVD